MGLIDIINPLSTVLISAVNKSRRCRESKLGPLGAKRERYPLCYAAPPSLLLGVRTYGSLLNGASDISATVPPLLFDFCFLPMHEQSSFFNDSILNQLLLETRSTFCGRRLTLKFVKAHECKSVLFKLQVGPRDWSSLNLSSSLSFSFFIWALANESFQKVQERWDEHSLLTKLRSASRVCES